MEQVWKLLWQRPPEGPLKAWPPACRHNSGHNPTYSLMKAHLWVEVAQPTAVLVQIKGPSTAASSVLQWLVEDAYRKCKTAANCSMSPSHTHPALSVSSLGSYLIGTSPLYHHIILFMLLASTTSCGSEFHNFTLNSVGKCFILFVVKLLLNKVM